MFLNILCMGQSSTTKISGPTMSVVSKSKNGHRGWEVGMAGGGGVVRGNGDN